MVAGREPAVAEVKPWQGAVMEWARILAYVTGTVEQELLEVMAAELLLETVEQA